MLLIVPNSLHDAIHESITKVLGGRPCDDESREILYQQILKYYDDHGNIPNFTLTEKASGSDNG